MNFTFCQFSPFFLRLRPLLSPPESWPARGGALSVCLLGEDRHQVQLPGVFFVNILLDAFSPPNHYLFRSGKQTRGPDSSAPPPPPARLICRQRRYIGRYHCHAEKQTQTLPQTVRPRVKDPLNHLQHNVRREAAMEVFLTLILRRQTDGQTDRQTDTQVDRHV